MLQFHHRNLLAVAVMQFAVAEVITFTQRRQVLITQNPLGTCREHRLLIRIAGGKVVEGQAVIDSLYNGYGDGPPQGNGPNQGQLQARGNAYLKESFPSLDYIKSAAIVASETPATSVAPAAVTPAATPAVTPATPTVAPAGH